MPSHITPRHQGSHHAAPGLPCAAALWLSLALTACAIPTDHRLAQPGAAAPPARPQSSAECLAAKIKPGEPFPASAIPDEVLRKQQSGWVALRFDLVAGKTQNVVVVSSNPTGVYDSYALQHAIKFRDPAGTTVRGCVMTIDVKF